MEGSCLIYRIAGVRTCAIFEIIVVNRMAVALGAHGAGRHPMNSCVVNRSLARLRSAGGRLRFDDYLKYAWMRLSEM